MMEPFHSFLYDPLSLSTLGYSRVAAVDFRKRDTIISKIDRSYSKTNYIFSHLEDQDTNQGAGVINICVIFVWLAARNTVKF